MKKKIKHIIQSHSKTIGEKLGIDLPYYLENGFWVSANQIIQISVGLGLSVLLARFTTEEVFGNYQFLISILSIFSIISLPGMSVSVLRSVARGKHGTYKKSVGLSFIWSIAGLPILSLAGVYYLLFDEQVLGILILAAVGLLPFIFPFARWDALYQGRSKFNLSAVFSSAKICITSGFIIIALFLTDGDLFYLFLTYLVSNAAVNIIFYLLSLKQINNNDTDEDWKKSGFKLTLIAIISYVYDYADKIIIGIMLDPARLAVYSIAAALIIYMRTGLKMLIRVVAPKIFKADKALLKSIFRRYIGKFFIFLTLACVVFWFIIPYLITFLYSLKYEESIFYAQIYLISIPATGLVIFLQQYLLAYSKENFMIKSKAYISAFNLILYIILIPYLEIMGAVIASIAYYFVNAIVFFIYIRRVQK